MGSEALCVWCCCSKALEHCPGEEPSAGSLVARHYQADIVPVVTAKVHRDVRTSSLSRDSLSPVTFLEEALQRFGKMSVLLSLRAALFFGKSSGLGFSCPEFKSQFISWVSLGKSFQLFQPQFPHL